MQLKHGKNFHIILSSLTFISPVTAREYLISTPVFYRRQVLEHYQDPDASDVQMLDVDRGGWLLILEVNKDSFRYRVRLVGRDLRPGRIIGSDIKLELFGLWETVMCCYDNVQGLLFVRHGTGLDTFNLLRVTDDGQNL